MKLFVIASLIAVSAAARLEHLERSYLPPNQGQGSFGSNGFGSFGANSGSNGFGHNSGSLGSTSGSNGFGTESESFSSSSGSNGFGANSGSFGAHSGNNGVSSGFGSNGFGTSAGRPGGSNSAFPSATSNQYLPPNQGSAASGGAPQLNGFGQGFGAKPQSQYQPQQPSSSFGQNPQQSAPSSQFGTPSAQFGGQSGFSSPGSFGSRYQSGNQFAAANRQYLAPKAPSSFQNLPQQSFDDESGYHY